MTETEPPRPILVPRNSAYLNRFTPASEGHPHRKVSPASSGTSQGSPDHSLRTHCRTSPSQGPPPALAVAAGIGLRCRSLLLCRIDSY